MNIATWLSALWMFVSSIPRHDSCSRKLRTRIRPLTGMSLVMGLGIVSTAPLPVAQAVDRLVLRNLEIVSDRTVTRFDEDGLRLDDGRVLTWDEVERGTVAERQDEFNQFLAELGEPLYRIRQRLTVGDYEGVLAPAESVYPRFVARRSPTAYMVFQGLMWSRLAVGKREAALEPYLLGMEYLRHRSAGTSSVSERLPGDRRLSWDAETGMTDELLPIWFDASAAQEALPGVGRAVGAMKKPWPDAVPLYYASLALGAGESARAAAALKLFDSTRPVPRQLATILAAQQEIAAGEPAGAVVRLRSEWESYEGMNRALASYWLGRVALQAVGSQAVGSQTADERQANEGLLLLLSVPALSGTTFTDLAGAALDEARRFLHQAGLESESQILREELLRRFGTTYHARQLKSQE